MTEAVAIKKPRGIDDLLRDMNVQIPDEERTVATIGEHPFSALLEKYEAFLGKWDEYQKLDRHNTLIQNCIRGPSTITDILAPDEINQFLQTTINYEEREKYGALTGIFITRLIQNSYNAGNNDFQINTRSLTKNLNWLGAFLKGENTRKLEMSIIGEVGFDCGISAENLTYTIKGNTVYSCGVSAENSTFNITGDAGYHCGILAKNSTFNITGDVKGGCGRAAKNSTFNITGNVEECGEEANHSTFNITGDAGWSYEKANHSLFNITGDVGECIIRAKNSTFKTSNEKTLKKLCKNILYDCGNTIIYLRPDGSEEVYRK